MSTAFLLTTLVIVATPGTGAVLRDRGWPTWHPPRSWRPSRARLGTLPHMVAAITGLAALLHASGWPSRS